MINYTLLFWYHNFDEDETKCFAPRFLINRSSTGYFFLVIPNLLNIFSGIYKIDSSSRVLITVLFKSTFITPIDNDIF
jgi:hypothetical protein